jgi:hypothetical protein
MNPLPEGFKMFIWPEYRLVTPSYSVKLSRSKGILMSAFLSRYGKPVMRAHLVEDLWGDDENGGPDAANRTIDVLICRMRREFRAIGIDFEHRGNWAMGNQAAITLTGLREVEPYGGEKHEYNRDRQFEFMRNKALNAKAEELMNANGVFMSHRGVKVTAPWTHNARVEASSLIMGEPV